MKTTKQRLWTTVFIRGTAIFCLLHIISLLPDLHLFIGDEAFVIDDITSVKNSDISFSTHSIWERFHSYLPLEKSQFIGCFVGLYMLALVALACNRVPLLAVVVALSLKVILNNSMRFYLYGLDGFEVIALFYCFIFISSAKIVQLPGDQKFLRPKNMLRLLQAHLCIVYFFGGLGKILGHNWWNGESVWKAIHLVDSPDYLNNYALGKYGFVWTGLGIATFALELLYPLGINFSRSRNFFLFGIIGMHTFIGIFIGLHFFSAFMIFLNICAYVIPHQMRKKSVPQTYVPSSTALSVSTGHSTI